MIQVIQPWRQALATVAVLGALVLGTPAQAAQDGTWAEVRQAGVLRCGAAVSPPYVMRDSKSGEYSGVFPTLCRQFGEEVLKVKVEFVDSNWDSIVAGLQSQKWDVSVSLNDTPQRRQAIAFTEPAVDYSINFTYNQNNPKLPRQINSLADIDKPALNIVVMSGTAADKAISAEFKQARIMRLPGFDETRLALMSKRADLLADDNMTNQLLTAAHGDWATTFTPMPMLGKQGIAFGLRKETPAADIDEFNAFIARKKADGAIDGLVQASIKASLAQAR
ncbi:transporter substrate-binding domain-containing protein [Pantoea sp. Ap-967]|uniref:substrate-binding periplasmic protein n=1 Tax=Pantoea sp. Ap-967 TaxID=2608362 RepID=UPI0014236CC7|nr:transporter substrate-binding domain-containing protein [Pantoea sp. Ap-967]NIE73095.1 transporter substrate-binding domain-containing protein [Pantoea sp. Ap-967]